MPFVHAHKANEEIYFILSGKGKVEIDGQTVDLVEGDWLRIAPEGRRRIFASPDSPIGFICIQVKAGSLGPTRPTMHWPERGTSVHSPN